MRRKTFDGQDAFFRFWLRYFLMMYVPLSVAAIGLVLLLKWLVS